MSWCNFDDTYGILAAEERHIEETQDHPSLQSVPGESPHWESFNQWLCFPTDSVEVGCFEHKTDERWENSDPEKREGQGFYSVMHLEHAGLLYRFESPGWTFPKRCLEETAKLKELIKDQEGMCVFAAYLPTYVHLEANREEEQQSWVYYGVKTKLGRVTAPIYDVSGRE